jgi:hypothetical protein
MTLIRLAPVIRTVKNWMLADSDFTDQMDMCGMVTQVEKTREETYAAIKEENDRRRSLAHDFDIQALDLDVMMTKIIERFKDVMKARLPPHDDGGDDDDDDDDDDDGGDIRDDDDDDDDGGGGDDDDDDDDDDDIRNRGGRIGLKLDHERRHLRLSP